MDVNWIITNSIHDHPNVNRHRSLINKYISLLLKKVKLN